MFDFLTTSTAFNSQVVLDDAETVRYGYHDRLSLFLGVVPPIRADIELATILFG